MKGRTVAMLAALSVVAATPATYGQGKSSRPDVSASQDKPKPDRNRPSAQSYSAEVLILHATRGKKPPPKPWIDPRIGRLPELEKEPFSRYDRYDLIDKAQLPLLKEDPKTLTLPDGRVLKTALVEVLPHDQLRLRASIKKPGGKDFLPLLEVKAKTGQPFIVAGQNYKGGILVLVIRVQGVARGSHPGAGGRGSAS
jgi:hypothetical protein